jgi:hypothetical protein
MHRVLAAFRRRDAGLCILFAVAGAAWGGCISKPNLTPADSSAGVDGGDALSEGEAGGEPDAATNPVEDGSVEDPGHAACVAACPPGGTCDGDTCVLACPGMVTCMLGVKCPAGVPCRVTCSGPHSCGIVDCGTAASCAVTCTGDTACAKVRSGAVQTTVTCSGKNACKDTRCDGDTCTVDCDGDACKAPDIACCAMTSCTVNGSPGTCK